MIGPKAYIQEWENKSYEELLEEKKRLNQKIEEYENHPEESSEVTISPSLDVRYQCNLEYMAELCSLIAKKYQTRTTEESKKEDTSVFTSYVGMNCAEIKNLITEKTNLLKDKLDGKIDDNEKSNSGYLFWNCKTILRNIYMSYDKLTSKFKEELSSEELVTFTKKSNIIKEKESQWKTMDDIRETFDLLVHENEEDNSNLLKCPNCHRRLMFMMSTGNTLYCSQCNKYYRNNNGSVGEETSSPYTEKDALY